MSSKISMFDAKSTTLQSGAEATGNGTTFDLNAFYGHVTVQVTGITTATVTLETSNDGGTTWDTKIAMNEETGAVATSISANGTFSCSVLGVKKFRARISAYTSGTIYVYAVAVPFSVSNATTAQLTGSILADETNKAVTLNTDILTDYTATKTMQTTLMVATNTSGILKLEVDGSLNSLNGGTALDTGKWYAFDVPVLADSVYNLQLTASATMQIKWIGGF